MNSHVPMLTQLPLWHPKPRRKTVSAKTAHVPMRQDVARKVMANRTHNRDLHFQSLSEASISCRAKDEWVLR